MLAMDSDIRRHGGCGNICHLLVRFAAGTDIEPLRQAIALHPIFGIVSSLRLVRRLLRAPLWRSTTSRVKKEACPTYSWSTTGELEGWVLSHSIDETSEAPFGCIALPLLNEGPALLFYWHHALCDAHGGERLVSMISKSNCPSTTDIIPNRTTIPSLALALRRAHATKKRIYELAREPRAQPTPAQQPDREQRIYRKISFSPEETSAIDELSKTATGGIFPTAMYLAATTRALSSLGAGYGYKTPFFVPVPHDIRRLTRQQSPLTNQVSVAFFRIAPSSNKTLLDTTNEIIGQLHDTVAGEHQQGIFDFLRLLRWLPPRILWRIIEHPVRGHPASFYFSDIGASLSTLDSIHDVPVVYATHYPPLLSPPGFTTVWSRYRGSLEVTVCADLSVIGENGAAAFAERLREEILP